ncbi:MAG: DoxX family protein [Bryobacteraceae bacterium]|nr:DoxX family protein [Bryobacteraceae bacterium]
MQLTATTAHVSKKRLWTGRIMSAVPVLMLFASAMFKLASAPGLEEGFSKLGWPASLAVTLGVLELTCTAIYLTPRTSVLGAILLTGYLGGAIATHMRIGDPYVMPALLGMLLWGGLWFRDPRLQGLIPVKSDRPL